MVVLDSSFLIAFHNSRDVHHEAAAAAMAKLADGRWGRGALLEYVVLEVATVMLARRGLEIASSVASLLLKSRELDFVPCSDLFADTMETFRRQTNSTWSFTDAAIVALARKRGARWIATFDQDFAGVDGISTIPASRSQRSRKK